jgi:Tol biopolymer transport system component
LSLVPAGGGTPRTLSADTDAAAWAPDSRRLAFPGELDVAGSARLTVQNEDGSGRRGLGERRPIYTLSWSADGKRLLYSTNAPWETERDTGRIHAVDAATGADAVVARGVDPAWSHDGRLLSFVRRVKGRMTLYVLGHEVRHLLRSGDGFTFAHAWSRSGHRLAFAATNRIGQFRIYVYDADGSAAPRPLTSLRYGPVVDIAWSPAGHRLLFERMAG